MNIIFELYFAVFAIFASLLITEIMGSVVLLLFWKQANSKVLEYIVPIWEVTGTFAAFLVVMGDFAYPSLLVPIASIFAPLLTVFLILFVARNASLAFAEFIIKRKWLDRAKLYRIYAVSTLILGFTVLVLLSALVSGAGVNFTGGNLFTWRLGFFSRLSAFCGRHASRSLSALHQYSFLLIYEENRFAFDSGLALASRFLLTTCIRHRLSPSDAYTGRSHSAGRCSLRDIEKDRCNSFKQGSFHHISQRHNILPSVSSLSHCNWRGSLC